VVEAVETGEAGLYVERNASDDNVSDDSPGRDCEERRRQYELRSISDGAHHS
jgi:hypothetical protein